MKSIATRAQVRSGSLEKQQRCTTILVTEDERFVREVTCETLRNAGYRVLGAECAAAARKKFLRYRKRIHLLLCDVVLPDSNGVLLAQVLHRLSPGLQVILASGYPRRELDEECSQEIDAEFLSKPYSAASLISRVQFALQKEHPSGLELRYADGNGRPE